MTIQISGMLFGNILSGQLGELFGRKKPLFFAVFLVMAFNIVGFFANSWVVFAVCRFFIGAGHGAFMTMNYALLCEFSLADWRAWIIGFPSWPVEASIFAFLAWLIKDWRYIQVMIAATGIPCLMAWW